jgi:hypothetical protein
MPGLVLAMTLLPIARPLRAPDGRARWTLYFLTLVYAITVLATPRWYTSYIVGAVFITLALVWAPGGLGILRARNLASRALVTAAAVAVLVLAVVLGRSQEVQYANQAYTKAELFLQEGGPIEAYEYARNLKDQRIGIVGSSQIIFGQFGFFGANLSNEVDWIGPKGPHGSMRLPTSCRQFRGLINEGKYDYVIMSQFTQDSPYSEYWYPIYAWVKKDPGLEKVVDDPASPQRDFVFRVKGKLSPSTCKPEPEAGAG